MFEFVIEGELPGLNEIIKASKSHYGQYSKMKKLNGQIILLYIRNALNRSTGAFNGTILDKVDANITWYTKNEKMDPDNVACGVKFILDSLVDAKVLKNDTRKYVGNIHHYFATDKKNPRIEVRLTKHSEVN